MSSGFIRLTVAGLQVTLDALGAGMQMTLPPCHARFLSECSPQAANCLTLTIRNYLLRKVEAWHPVYVLPNSWHLWRDETGLYVFAVDQAFSAPARQITVDDGFRSGEVLCQFNAAAVPAQSFYPLRDLDIVLFVNWLAGYGDLLLHASGVIIDGRGYAFAGASGAGKSTLATAFIEHSASFAASPLSLRSAQDAGVAGVGSGVTMLGEDNLVLRRMDGGFRLYGTPWHLDPARCAAADAPLEKLFFLDRTAPYGVAACPPVDGIGRLLQTAFIPYYRPDAVTKILDTLAILAERVPFYTLSYRLGDDPMELIRNV